MKFLKGFMLLGVVAMLINCGAVASGSSPLPAEEIYPTTCMVVAMCHWVWRCPYRPFALWELPFMLVSLSLMGYGAFHFRPEKSEDSNFQVFLTVFAVLALIYGFFCSAVGPQSPLRSEVIARTKAVSRLGLPGFDLGLVLAPLVFPVYLARYWLKNRV